MLRLCIAGTRGYYGGAFYVATRIAIAQATKELGLNAEIVEIVSGMCKNSPDMIGVDLAHECGVPVKEFPAKWLELDAPGAVFRTGMKGQYNVRAGYDRNIEIAEYLAQHEHLIILLWDGKSRGTAHFKKECEKRNLRLFEYIPVFQDAPADEVVEP